MKVQAQLNLDCAATKPSGADSMKGKEHQENCSLCVRACHNLPETRPESRTD